MFSMSILSVWRSFCRTLFQTGLLHRYTVPHVYRNISRSIGLNLVLLTLPLNHALKGASGAVVSNLERGGPGIEHFEKVSLDAAEPLPSEALYDIVYLSGERRAQTFLRSFGDFLGKPKNLANSPTTLLAGLFALLVVVGLYLIASSVNRQRGNLKEERESFEKEKVKFHAEKSRFEEEKAQFKQEKKRLEAMLRGSGDLDEDLEYLLGEVQLQAERIQRDKKLLYELRSKLEETPPRSDDAGDES